MKEVVIAGVEKTYEGRAGGGAVAAVRGVDLLIEAGEFFVLLGASGSGKTTLLRCVAGLESITGGEIRIGGVTVASGGRVVPAVKRNIGMVFQDYAIWPHMTVGQNVEFALRHARSGSLRGAAATKRVREVLDVVGLGELVDRGSTYLSGGQQQRVALARAVVAKPDVLLLDEPLSNLDARLRASMRTELRRITSEFGVTSLYVTHDQIEALTMADRIAVMRHGQVLQVGTPQEIYRTPCDVYVGEFVGETNVVPGRVAAGAGAAAGQLVNVESALGPLVAMAVAALRPGQEINVLIRPENFHLRREGLPSTSAEPSNSITGLVPESAFVGAHTDLAIRVRDVSLRAQVHSFDSVPVGSSVTLHVGAHWLVALAAQPVSAPAGIAAEVAADDEAAADAVTANGAAGNAASAVEPLSQRPTPPRFGGDLQSS